MKANAIRRLVRGTFRPSLSGRTVVLSVLGLLCLPSLAPAQLFLVNDEKVPQVTVRWQTRDGETVEFKEPREYRSLGERKLIGKNVECFVTLGGIRLARGLGDPRGGIVRVGLVKHDLEADFFDQIAPDSAIEIELRNVSFNKPGTPMPETTIQELGYTDDPALCGLPGQLDAQYNAYSLTDHLREKITKENGRMGVLRGKKPTDGKVEYKIEDDGSITMRATLPYGLLRHVNDPWVRESPGAFREPTHFHIEFEVLPEDVAGEPLESTEPVEGDTPANDSKKDASDADQ